MIQKSKRPVEKFGVGQEHFFTGFVPGEHSSRVSMNPDCTEEFYKKQLLDYLEDRHGQCPPAAHSQFYPVFARVCSLTAKHLHAGCVGDETEFLHASCEFLSHLQCAVFTPEQKALYFSDDEVLTDDRLAARKVLSETFWFHKDVYQAFTEGLNSEHHVQIDPGELEELSALYQGTPWLSDPLIDWYLVDMLVANAVVQHGEAIKRDKALFLTAYNDSRIDYLRARGDLRKMKKESEKFLIRNFLYKKLGGDKGAITAIELWGKMARVYDLLEGPTINPAMLRKELNSSRDAGAVWPPLVYSIVDRAVSRDPSVWIISYKD